MISEAYKTLLQYTGSPDQVFYAQRMTLRDGRADRLEVIDVDNGTGLHFWVLPGRCMDIGRLSLHGENLSFLSKAGFSNAAHYEPDGMNGLHSFAPGFLTTCGLRNSGLPCFVGGEAFGFHGRIGQTPAEEISILRDMDGEAPCIRITGRTREGWLFGPHLELERSITVYYGRNELHIEDRVRNLAAVAEPVMMLYHFNMGYPFLTENCEFLTSHAYLHPVDENAKRLENQRLHFKAPADQIPENCFYYKQQRNDEGSAFAACVDYVKMRAVMVCTDPEELPLLCNWQSWASGDYVMGIEPCTCFGDGRAAHLERGEMVLLEPYESRSHHLTVRFLEGAETASLFTK